MYDLPLTETNELTTIEELISSPDIISIFGTNPKVIAVYPIPRHVLTHQHIYARFIHVDINIKKIKLEPTWFFIKVENMHILALPKIIFVFLTKLLNF